MKQLENRTILQKYGIDEMTIFLHFNEVYKENKFLMELSLFNYFNLIDPTVPMVNQILFTFYRSRVYIYETISKELWLYDVP